MKPSRTFSVCVYSTIGRRAIFSSGSLSRWVHFSRRALRHPFRPGSCTLAALEHFRVPAFQRAEGDPAPLPYLQSETNQSAGGIDVKLEVLFRSARMRGSAAEPVRLCQSSLRDLYWTAAQLITHHSSNGCNLRPGDLIGSGTVSGTAQEAMGCLLERTHGGAVPIHLPNGEQRTYLEDGDEVTLRGYCERKGFPRIGFGECSGVVTSAASIQIRRDSQRWRIPKVASCAG